MKGAERQRRDAIALLKLAREPLRLGRDEDQSAATPFGGSRRRFPSDLPAQLVALGSLERVGDGYRRTEAGTARLRRLLAGEGLEGGHGEQHVDRLTRAVPDENGAIRQASANRNESALLKLARAGGKAFLHAELIAAGERLRADFERAQLRQRVTMDWSRTGGSGSAATRGDLSDSAVAARGRWERALEDLGAELGPATIDLCCFDLGLTDIEKRHGWPKRSGKFMLRAGLDRLARHYRAPRAHA